MMINETMAAVAAGYLEGLVDPLKDPGPNSSLYFDLDPLGNGSGLEGGGYRPYGYGHDENVTELLLVNGTRTKVPVFRPRRRGYSFPVLHSRMMMVSYYSGPVILVVGLVSNILAYLVFTRTRLKKVPSVPYLAAMAVVDSGALVTDFIQTGLKEHGFDLIGKVGVCQYVTFLHFVFLFLCVWYPVALCVEKFISVYCPLRKAGLCTPFRAKVVIISMAVMTGVCYNYIIYMMGTQETLRMTLCVPWMSFRKDYNLLMKLNTVFVNLLPTAALVVLVGLICGRGCEYYRISSAVEVSNRPEPGRNYSMLSPHRVTNVIFPVVLIMLLLKTPKGISQFYISMRPPYDMPVAFRQLTLVFLYVDRLNLAVKLYVYLAFSPAFRRRTRSFLRGVRAKFRGHCCRLSSDDEDDEDEEEREGEERGCLMEGSPMVVAVPRINLVEVGRRSGDPRSCLAASDV